MKQNFLLHNTHTTNTTHTHTYIYIYKIVYTCTNTGKPYWIGKLSTIDLLVLINLNQLLFILLKIVHIFIRNYLLQRVHQLSRPFPSVSIPWYIYIYIYIWQFCNYDNYLDFKSELFNNSTAPKNIFCLFSIVILIVIEDWLIGGTDNSRKTSAATLETTKHWRNSFILYQIITNLITNTRINILI